MMRFSRQVLVLVAILAAAIPEGGCGRWKKTAAAKEGAPSTPPRIPESQVKRFSNPAVVADLRERAIKLLEKLANDPDPVLRTNAIEALSEVPYRLEPLIPKALADVNPAVRSTAAMMVGRLKMTSAVPTIQLLVRDVSPYVQASAVYALSRCGAPVDPTPLGTMLLTDRSTRVRAHVAYLLGELGDPSAVPMLREATAAKIPRATPAELRLFQLQVAEAMVKLGEDSQLEVIRAALYPSRPEDLEITALAVQIIGQIRDRGAMDQLIYITAYRDTQEGQMPAEVRLGAAGSLARLGNDRGTFIADAYVTSPLPAVRAQTAYVYGQIGRTENLPRLEGLMHDSAAITRASAAAGILKVASTVAQFPDSR